ncbi:MAG: DUF1465 family protein [Sphingomonadales bacterium]|jgi:hypothetical protein
MPRPAVLPVLGAGNANLGSLTLAARRGGARPSLRDAMDALYADTIVVSEAARRWLDGPGLAWREALPPEAALAAALECLGVTTRLLAVMNWLLDPARQADPPVLQAIACPLPPPLPDDHPMRADEAGGPIVMASRDLLARAHRLATGDAP